MTYNRRWRGPSYMLAWAEQFLQRRPGGGRAAIHELVAAVWRDGFAAGNRARLATLRARLGLEDDSEAAADLATAELVAASSWRAPWSADPDPCAAAQVAEIPKAMVGRFRTSRALPRKK